MEQSTRQLLLHFVWGNEPENNQERRKILVDRGVNLAKVIREIDEVIKEHSEK